MGSLKMFSLSVLNGNVQQSASNQAFSSTQISVYWKRKYQADI